MSTGRGQPAATTAQRVAAPKPAPAQGQLQRSQTRLAWILLVPTLAVVVFIALWPLAQTIYLSFTDARLASGQPAEFIGVENYSFLFSDPAWWNAVWVTLKFAFITVAFEFVLGLIVALVISSNFKGRGLMRTAMLVPWAIPTVVSAQMWNWMYNDIYGVVNDLLVNKFGILSQNVAWIAQPNTALPAIAAVDIWKTTPFVALLLLAGLQVIPSDVYEAATVDGANKLQQFTRVTLPLLMPAILVTLIFRTLDAVRVFDVFYVMFGARPDTQTMAIYNQQQLVAFSDLGYGSAVSVAIFVVIGIIVAAYVTFLRVEEV
ncbi:MAG: sugar ABC transporter permease [Chloroflexota bacterium]|nr:sugar ABC transporter permease [Chloroflexota bacterium]PLS80313.1 MAG: ABC transporter permease [Chloroflexota bacterium]